MSIAPWLARTLPASVLMLALWHGATPDLAAHETPPPTSSHYRASPAPIARVPAAATLFAGFFQDVVGNRSRIMQASFLCIALGIFILWKK